MGNCCTMMQVRSNEVGGQIALLLAVCLAFQWSIVCRGFCFMALHRSDEIRVDVHDLSEAVMAAFSVAVSIVYVLGRTAGIHTLMIVIIHVPLYNANKFLLEEFLLVSDPGNSLSLHLFGAIFGFFLHVIALRGQQEGGDYEHATSDFTGGPSPSAHLGPMVVFIAFPILNSIVSESDAEMTRAITNTLLSEVSALVTVSAIMISVAHVRERSFDAHLLQGAFISGGVGVGAVGTLMVQPYGAMLVGMVTGIVTSFSYLYLETLFQKQFNIPSSGGILSFHGISATVGGLTSVIMASISESESGLVIYYNSLYPLYPARVPTDEHCNDKDCIYTLGTIISNYPFLEDKAMSRSALDQALHQGYGLVATIGVAVVGGLITGTLIKVSSERCGNSFPVRAWHDESFLLNRRNEREGSRRRSISKSNSAGEETPF